MVALNHLTKKGYVGGPTERNKANCLLIVSQQKNYMILFVYKKINQACEWLDLAAALDEGSIPSASTIYNNPGVQWKK